MGVIDRAERPLRVVVVGGVAAGMSAAAKAARVAPDAEVSVYTDEAEISYSACSLPYFIGRVVAERGWLVARTPEEMAGQGVHVYTGHKVVGLHHREKRIQIRTSEGRDLEVPYDRLILATGASPVKLSLPGGTPDGVFTLRSIPDAVQIQEYLDRWRPERAVVIGGGFIGLEMAEVFTSLGLGVTVLEKQEQILPTLDPDMAALLRGHLEQAGVEICCGQDILAFEGTGRVTGVRTAAGVFPAGLVLQAIGMRPNNALAVQAGICLGDRGAILVDGRMHTSHQDILAAGDCATAYHISGGYSTYMPMGTTANKQGKVAGSNAVGGDAWFPGMNGTAICKAFQWEAARTGLSTREALRLGIDVWQVTISSHTKASGYPGRGPVSVKLLMRESDDVLVGGQIVGAEGAGKRIDVLAAMVQTGQTPAGLARLDLAYAPPFSPVWDPLLTAANKAVSEIERR